MHSTHLGLGTLGLLFTSGVLGSFGHCLGMCGPLVAMLGLQLGETHKRNALYHLLYHGARITVYALMGALAAGLAAGVSLRGQLSQAAGLVSILLGLGVILVGLGYIGWLPLGRGRGTAPWLGQAMAAALRQKGLLSSLYLGALNGLLPCGLVYSSLLLSASMGSAVAGAAGMIVFGVATLAALFIFGLGAASLGPRVRQRLMYVAGALLLLVGLQLVLRGLASLGVVPHWMPGGVMLW